MKDGWNPYNTKGSSHRIFIRILSKSSWKHGLIFMKLKRKGRFIKISRKNHRRKIVKNKIGVTEKGLFDIS